MAWNPFVSNKPVATPAVKTQSPAAAQKAPQAAAPRKPLFEDDEFESPEVTRYGAHVASANGSSFSARAPGSGSINVKK